MKHFGFSIFSIEWNQVHSRVVDFRATSWARAVFYLQVFLENFYLSSKDLVLLVLDFKVFLQRFSMMMDVSYFSSKSFLLLSLNLWFLKQARTLRIGWFQLFIKTCILAFQQTVSSRELFLSIVDILNIFTHSCTLKFRDISSHISLFWKSCLTASR